MDCTATRLTYKQTRVFPGIILDYLDRVEALQPFYKHNTDIAGIQQAIEERKNFNTDRTALVDSLRKQYAQVQISAATEANITLLLQPTCFTITTAHQPNIFTGPLYFIYKIIHVIRLAENCKTLLPGYDFVPVYYMGNEDADLDELGHFYLGGEKLRWNTAQTGAVGRMIVDKQLLSLIDLAEGQLSVWPYGHDIIQMVRDAYQEGVMVQDATFKLVNNLFASFGLVVLLPDNALLKRQMIAVFKEDLLSQSASGLVAESANQLSKLGYKVQANPRDINLFYLKDNIRERIEQVNAHWSVLNTSIRFTEAALLDELQQFPERFSPNVILRGLYQETILPNLIFVGGGGETAYWLQLKKLFDHYHTPFPVLVLRNSFMIVEQKAIDRLQKLNFAPVDLFLGEEGLLNTLVIRDSSQTLQLNGVLTEAESLYNTVKEQATAIDGTLAQHVEALRKQSIHRLQELEKKMLRAEKRKFTDQQRQIKQLRQQLFPNNGLQERTDNLLFYYARWGESFIQTIYQHSLSLEQEFVVLQEGK